jgi:hypothetical protein
MSLHTVCFHKPIVEELKHRDVDKHMIFGRYLEAGNVYIVYIVLNIVVIKRYERALGNPARL